MFDDYNEQSNEQRCFPMDGGRFLGPAGLHSTLAQAKLWLCRLGKALRLQVGVKLFVCLCETEFYSPPTRARC